MKNRLNLALAASLFAIPLMPSLVAPTTLHASEASAHFFNPESMAQAFVLETKQIVIPEHPHAFNGSVIRYNGTLLMSFRELDTTMPISEDNSSGYSNIGLVWLDDNFEPISSPQLLAISARIEDPRLVMVDEKLHLVFADSLENEEQEHAYRRMYDATITFQNDYFFLNEPRLLSNFEGELADRHEKNWVPFDYDERLLFAYSINPHRILQATDEGCRNIATTHFNFTWPWGEPRGGTPAVAIDDQSYLGFFHSSTTLESTESEGQSMPHYFMGAYLFNQQAPFAITHATAEPIVGPSFYAEPRYTPYWKDVRVVFPCGFIADESAIWLMFGRQDHEIWVAKLDKAALLDSLVPVTTSQFDQPATLTDISKLPESAWAFELQLATHETKALKRELKHLKAALPELEMRLTQTQAEIALINQAIEEAENSYWGSWVKTLDGGNFLAQILGNIVAFISTDYQQARLDQRELALDLAQANHNLADQTQDYEQYQGIIATKQPMLDQLIDRKKQLAQLISQAQQSPIEQPVSEPAMEETEDTSYDPSQDTYTLQPWEESPIDANQERPDDEIVFADPDNEEYIETSEPDEFSTVDIDPTPDEVDYAYSTEYGEGYAP